MFFIYKGVKINYTVKGEGCNILFLHGWGGSTQSFAAFENCLKGYRCINIDFPPFAKSGKLTEPWTVEAYSGMVLALLKKLQVSKVFVVAHSFGARVAIMLCRIPNLAQKLVLTGAAGLMPKKSIKKRLSIMRYKLSKHFVKIKLMNQKRLSKFGSSDYQNADVITKQTIINIVNFDQSKMLSNIAAPTLLIWGKNDKDTPMYMARKFNRLIKDSALITLPGDHFAYIQNFNQVFAIIENFFADTYK